MQKLKELARWLLVMSFDSVDVYLSRFILRKATLFVPDQLSKLCICVFGPFLGGAQQVEGGRLPGQLRSRLCGVHMTFWHEYCFTAR